MLVDLISKLNQSHFVNVDSTLKSMLKQGWNWVDAKSNLLAIYNAGEIMKHVIT